MCFISVHGFLHHICSDKLIIFFCTIAISNSSWHFPFKVCQRMVQKAAHTFSCLICVERCILYVHTVHTHFAVGPWIWISGAQSKCGSLTLCPIWQKGAQIPLSNLPLHCSEEESGRTDCGGIPQTAEGETEVHHRTLFRVQIYNYWLTLSPQLIQVTFYRIRH